MRNKERATSSRSSSRAERAGAGTSKARRQELAVTKSRLFKIFSGNPDKAFGYKQLSRRLGVSDKAGRDLITEYLRELRKEGKLTILEGSNYILNTTSSYITGIVDLANPKYAYIVSDETEEDVRVFSEKLMFAMGGDRVKVRLYASGGDRPEGEVVEIIERAKDEIVGKVELSKNFAFIVPDFKKLYFDVFVGENDLQDAKNGDKVLVKITEWPTSSNKSPIGKVVRVFGQAGENEAEINSIMAEFGLPFEFPENVEKEAEAIPVAIPEEEIAQRRDFRNITTFTIDPIDAKDFDDALSIQQLENGHWEIGVHIADVTHYIQEKSQLEREAYHRATSVYLVDRTIPMLPEKLSNGLCSLRPHEEKLTFSAVFELDEKGKLYDQWIGKTIIYSDRRFTYEEAQQRIETGEGDFAQEILTLNKIAHELKDKRFKNGAISFETVEVKFKLDEQGKPVSVFIKERKDAHKLIEEFMLLANRKVAEFVFNMKKTKVRNTMVYRTHDAPDPDKLTNFSMFAKRFGYNLTVDNIEKVSDELNKLAEQTEGKPEQNVLQNLAIRTMAKAKYTTEPLGHFGLGFAHYSHFTSPIRRYPDMMAHRLIFHYLNGGKSADKEEYEEKCKYSSEMEKRAADAERASVKYKQVEFMQDTVGQQFKGIVSGVTEWGLYVEVQETRCEGMVRLSDLEDDYYELDAQNYRIIGRRSKRIISFGDEVMVEVKGVNLNDRTIDLLLAKEQKKEKKTSRSKKTETASVEAITSTEVTTSGEVTTSKEVTTEGRNIKDYYGFDE